MQMCPDCLGYGEDIAEGSDCELCNCAGVVPRVECGSCRREAVSHEEVVGIAKCACGGTFRRVDGQPMLKDNGS
jgi:hypothetical protein